MWKSRSKLVAAGHSHFAHGVEPQAHQFGVGLGSHATTVLGQEASLGHHVQPGEQRQSLIEDVAHDVAVTRRAEQLQPQQAAHGVRCRNHLAAGEAGLGEDAIQIGWHQRGEEQEQAPKAGAELAGTQIQGGDVGHGGGIGASAGRPFLVLASGQPGKALVLEDERDRHRTQGFHFPGESLADVVDRQILLAQGDDLLPEPLGFGGGFGALGRREEELAVGVLAELMDQDAEASGGVTTTAGGFGRGQSLDEEGAQGFVLAVGGVLRLEKRAGEVG